MGRLILQGKGLVVSLNHVGLWCEPEGLSSDGSLHTPTNRKTHQAREPRGPSPSGGKTPANLLSHERPLCALRARSPGCRGTAPASEVGGADAFAGKKGLAAAAENDSARFHDKAVIRRTKRRVGVLLDEQDRDAAVP